MLTPKQAEAYAVLTFCRLLEIGVLPEKAAQRKYLVRQFRAAYARLTAGLSPEEAAAEALQMAAEEKEVPD